ncbi:DUF6916 family protein [Novipirellula caenicola]|uniref:DUF6916 domain-containing protein n=1 Tax=Novipirellula caenicola TaxID=1536901 RepID=A0ABP9VKN7_9BACT
MSLEMKTPRRDFLAATTAIAAACAASVQVSQGTASDDLVLTPQSRGSMTADDFSERIGQSFRVENAYGVRSRQQATLVLEQVIPHRHDPQRPEHLRPRGYSLVFSPQNNERLESQTHRFQTAGMAAFDMLLNQTTPPGAARIRYEVVVN